MLWEELNPSLIITHMKAKNSSEVMEKIGSAAIKEGYAKSNYIEALIERESIFPTGLDLGEFGIAIPHTDTSFVLKDGIAIAVLETPVSFFNMGDDMETVEVQLVMLLLVSNPGLHMNRLQRILDIIHDKKVLKKMMEAQDKNEIIRVIREKENRL